MTTTRVRRGTATLALLAAAGIAATACSSGSSDDGAATPTAALTTVQSAPSSTASATPLSGSLDFGSSDPAGVTQPFIDHVLWVQTPEGPSLQVYPTPNGRKATAPADEGLAWTEVVNKADPTANTPGMQAQFNCHWEFARIVAPNKPSWNLEPWRPVVSYDQMIAARCNPGGPDI